MKVKNVEMHFYILNLETFCRVNIIFSYFFVREFGHRCRPYMFSLYGLDSTPTYWVFRLKVLRTFNTYYYFYGFDGLKT